jgi:hypothetical protein
MLPAALQGPRVAGPPITRVRIRSVSYSTPMTSLLPFPVWGSGCWASKRNARVWQKSFRRQDHANASPVVLEQCVGRLYWQPRHLHKLDLYVQPQFPQVLVVF